MIELFHGTSRANAHEILKNKFTAGCFADDLAAAREWSDDPQDFVILMATFSESAARAIFEISLRIFKFGECGQYRLKPGKSIPAEDIHLMTQNEISRHPDFSAKS